VELWFRQVFLGCLSVLQFPGRCALRAVEGDRDVWRDGLGLIFGDVLGVARTFGARDGGGATLALGAGLGSALGPED